MLANWVAPVVATAPLDAAVPGCDDCGGAGGVPGGGFGVVCDCDRSVDSDGGGGGDCGDVRRDPHAAIARLNSKHATVDARI